MSLLKEGRLQPTQMQLEVWYLPACEMTPIIGGRHALAYQRCNNFLKNYDHHRDKAPADLHATRP
ncbi:hypothetical protein PMPD1_3302 [Paramixta manurensis]|uniref:Uncharacterized protein n=1 Tax=Paramixta manurensis TaxID=2740817 RepID=A0A6M8UC44_9GAMM|nr:hypothetical protein PMPD1_3302 [Erwiniaceae bacterium PD-1]